MEFYDLTVEVWFDEATEEWVYLVIQNTDEGGSDPQSLAHGSTTSKADALAECRRAVDEALTIRD